MAFYRPTYYENFRCNGSECPFTCCSEWAIAVDSKTLKNWKTLSLPEGISVSDESSHPSDFVTDGHIKLGADGFCPFLDDSHLCNMVKTHGEESLSTPCHTFPREWHIFEGRTEETLSIACPEVLNTLWNLPQFKVIETNLSIPYEHSTEEAEPCRDVFFSIRDWFIEIMQHGNISNELALKIIFYFALDLYETYVEGTLTDSYFEEYKKNNLFDTLVNEIPKNTAPIFDTIQEQNELLLDLAENYRKQRLYSKWLEPICTLAEKIEFDDSTEKAFEEFQIIWNSHERQHNNILSEEIYSTCLIPGGDLYSMVMKLQWIAMTHAVYKQAMFLQWILSCKNADNTEKYDFQSHCMTLATIIFRMTGYSEADIEEYLENSFEEIIWEWPYIALIIG